MPAPRRVVVTGLGAVTPVGASAEATWQALLAGRTGTRRLGHPWMAAHEESFRTRLGAPVEGFDLTRRGFAERDVKTLDPTSCMAVAAAREAFESAGLHLVRQEGRGTAFRLEGVDPLRAASSVGSGVGGLTTFEASHEQWSRHHTFRGTAFLRYALPMLIPNAPAANVAIRFGLQAECRAAPTACAAGTMSIGDAFRLLRDDEADLAVAGGVDVALSDHDGLGLAGFDMLGVMSCRNDDPEHASRPFDRDRDGFVLGEGAAMLVLEAEEHAVARGARVLAEVLGYASTCDAHGMMQPDPDGRLVVRALELALRQADVAAADIGYVNAHGTGTPAGDPIEAAALRHVFGSGSGAPLVSATKSMTGHCLGASGAIEALATTCALRDGAVHQTANLEVVGEGCELHHVVGAPARRALDVALSASYGFGGHDAVLVLARR